METIEFVEKVLETLRDMDDAIDVICSLDAKAVVEKMKAADMISIPEGATNGDMIRTLFPNCEQKEHIYNGYFEMYFNNDLKDASYMRVSKDFWNAKYKNEVEE